MTKTKSRANPSPDPIIQHIVLKERDLVAVPRYGYYRKGTVLAVVSGEALIEYELPNGTTALVFSPADIGAAEVFDDAGVRDIPHLTVDQVRRNPFGYHLIPQVFLARMIQVGTEWIGNSSRGQALPVRETLKEASLR